VAGREIGLEVNADKLIRWSCLEIRMQEEVTIWRVLIVSLKGWKSTNGVFGKNLIKSKFYSGRN